MKSIWSENYELPEFQEQKGNLKTDVLIIGGGMAGILCARKLQQEGVDCIVVEADRICRGVTRNTTAKISSQHGMIYRKLLNTFGPETARAYWEASENALNKYRSLAERIECDFQEKSSFLYAVSDRKSLEEEMEALIQIGVKADFRDKVSLPVSVAGAIEFPNQAQFHPLKFVAGILTKLKILERTKVMEFEKYRVKTNRGYINAEKVIIATHFPILNKHGSYWLKMYQSRSYVLALQSGENVDGMYLGIDGDRLSLRNQGGYLLVGGESHRTGKNSRGWETLEQFARVHYPDGIIANRWANQDCMSLDGIPYIGRYSSATPDLYVATGFNKWGMTSSMLAADILTDLVQDRQNPCAWIYRPDRSMLHRQLLVNGFESGMNLIRPGKPRCPHLGCALKWNSQERSWDCTCHGSRFSEAGKLLNNPATDDLNR